MKLLARLFLIFILLAVATFATTFRPVHAQNMVTISLAATQVGVAETAQIDATITCDTGNCVTFAATLHFDPQYIRVDSAEVGPYLGAQIFKGDNVVDNVKGTISLAAASFSGTPSTSENVLFSIHVTGLVPGASQMAFDTLQVQDTSGNVLPLVQRGSDIVVVETGKIPPFSPPAYDWQVAFVTDRDGNPEIYSMNANGSDLKRLTDNPARDSAPDWSPGGDKIAFVSDRDGNSEIYVMGADGSNPVRLTNTANSETEPAWSPDGRQIAYISDQDGNPEIYVMNADGTNPVRLTNNPAVDDEPAWKPDGTQIAFISMRDGATSEVYLMDKDGNNVQRITNGAGANAWYPVFAPDGTKMAYTSELNGSSDIFSMGLDGSNPVKLTPESVPLTLSDWSPDSNFVAYASNRDGDADLYVINTNLNRLFRLNDDPSVEQEPDWKAGPVTCTISAPRNDVGVHVGPGANRSIYTFLKPNSVFSVIGQYADESGAIWWELDKTQVDPNYTGESLWVAESDVDEQGGCSVIAAAAPSELHQAAPPAGNGQWQPCGSCTTCGHPANECVTSPEGQCLWDPSTCVNVPPPPPGVTLMPGVTPQVPPAVCYSLGVSMDANYGSYSVSPSGSSGCGTYSYTPGTGVTVNVSPGKDYYLSNVNSTCANTSWSGNSVSVTMNGSCSVTLYLSYNG